MGPQPESFFWAGLLTALVPMLILGGLGALAVYLYLKERRGPTAGPNGGAEAPDAGTRHGRP